MRKLLPTLCLTAALGALSACTQASQPLQPTGPALTATTPPLATNAQVLADGKVVPARSVNLGFAITGTVAEIFVVEGDTVSPGQPLARLDTRDLQLVVEQAQVNLDQARADHERLLEGALPQQIAAAQAEVARAEGFLRTTLNSVTDEEIAAAKADLESAQQRLDELLAGPKAPDIQAAQATIDQARANLQNQRDTLSKAKVDAELRLHLAANALRNAQDNYSRIMWKNRELERAPGPLPQAEKDAEAAAKRAVADAETAVEQASLAYELAQQAERNGIESAEAQLADARARYDKLMIPPDPSAISNARYQVAAAQDRLSLLTGDQRAGDISQAEAGVSSARARLAELQAPPTDAMISASLARVKGAEVGLKQAQLAVEKATLIAPIAGTVVDVNLKVGELPNPTLAPLIIADLSEWQIETEDLSEQSVIQVREGDQVVVTFGALPGFELPGTVSQIKPLGESRQGDTVYTVVVTPNTWDDRLLWNMTATVQISGN